MQLSHIRWAWGESGVTILTRVLECPHPANADPHLSEAWLPLVKHGGSLPLVHEAWRHYSATRWWPQVECKVVIRRCWPRIGVWLDLCAGESVGEETIAKLKHLYNSPNPPHRIYLELVVETEFSKTLLRSTYTLEGETHSSLYSTNTYRGPDGG